VFTLKIVIFGTGSAAEKVIAKIQADVIVVAISDNNSEKWGETWKGYPIVSPYELVNVNFDYIVVCSMYTSEIIETLIQKGFSKSRVIPYFDNFYTSIDRARDREILKTIINTVEYEKNSVALVTRRNSGCNCRTLYKNASSEIRSKYNLELLNLDQLVDKKGKHEVLITTNTEGRFHKSRLNFETWHGFPIKTLGELEKYGTDQNENINNGTDYMFSYSDTYSYIMSSVFKVDIKKFVVTGMPRNDLLVTPNSREHLERIFNISMKHKKLFFYVPTFRRRNDKETREGTNVIADQEELQKLNHLMQEVNGYLILKKHPVEGDEFNSESFDNIFYLDDEALQRHDLDFYEILGSCDVLITDYSSVYFDFLLLDKPIVFWVKDYNEYSQQRGFLFDPVEEWMPGPIVENVKDLHSTLVNAEYEKEQYTTQRLEVRNRVHRYQDFNASERVWKFIDYVYSTEGE